MNDKLVVNLSEKFTSEAVVVKAGGGNNYKIPKLDEFLVKLGTPASQLDFVLLMHIIFAKVRLEGTLEGFMAFIEGFVGGVAKKRLIDAATSYYKNYAQIITDNKAMFGKIVTWGRILTTIKSEVYPAYEEFIKNPFAVNQPLIMASKMYYSLMTFEEATIFLNRVNHLLFLFKEKNALAYNSMVNKDNRTVAEVMLRADGKGNATGLIALTKEEFERAQKIKQWPGDEVNDYAFAVERIFIPPPHYFAYLYESTSKKEHLVKIVDAYAKMLKIDVHGQKMDIALKRISSVLINIRLMIRAVRNMSTGQDATNPDQFGKLMEIILP